MVSALMPAALAALAGSRTGRAARVDTTRALAATVPRALLVELVTAWGRAALAAAAVVVRAAAVVVAIPEAVVLTALAAAVVAGLI